MRLIHSASSHPARAISYVLKQEFLDYEKKLTHVYHTTDEFLADLRKLECEDLEDVMLLTADILDLYMNGQHERLAQVAFDHVEDEDKRFYLEKILNMVLDYQYVGSNLLEDVYAVIIGSGMGNICYGKVAGVMFSNWLRDSYLREKESTWFTCMGVTEMI